MIIGHERNIRYLTRLLSRRARAHAYLFFGPEGVGKKTVALTFTQSLLCSQRNRETFGGCGECPACRWVQALTHPDFIFLSLERPLVSRESRQEIGIEDIHEIQRRLGSTAWHGGMKVVIIDDAERLSRASQSALLKILEEPGRNTIFFLITVTPGALLATIRSRTIPLGFTTIPDETMGEFLHPHSDRERREMLELACGRPGVMMRLQSEPEFLAASRRRHQEFHKLARANLTEQLTFSEHNSREAEKILSWLLFLLERSRQEFLAGLNKNVLPEISNSNASILNIATFLKILLRRLIIYKTTHVNRRLLVDSIMVEYQLMQS